MSSPEDEKKKAQAQQQQKQGSTSTETSESKPQTPFTPKPSSTPLVGKPLTSTPIGGPTTSTPVAKPASTPIGKPVTSTPIGRPVTSTPVGTSVGRPAGSTTPGRPTIPQKPQESKQEMTRRNFLQLVAVAGGLIMIGSFAPLFPFLQGSVGQVSVTTQVIEDLKTGAPIKTSDIKPNSFSIFIWPRTGNPAVDADSFRQCVVIHLPSGLTAPSDLSAVDPLTNDTFIAFSRVCLHLWCLWNYIGTDQRMECPCHGSQYVPGTGQYPNFTQASNQPPGKAVAGPASLQTPPNNTLPIIKLSIAADGTISATSIVGQVGCGQLC